MNIFKRLAFISILVVLSFLTVHASRKSLYDAPFNLDWKFATGTQSGMEAKTYIDASWQTVSVPHSATYAAPVHSAEQSSIGATVASDYCYRKKFYCRSDVRKMFIYLGAIMQTATVYVNGTSVGSHSHSGYTAFFFDISNAVTRGDTNVVAIRCNAGPNGNIPPGGDGGQMPDFELFSGMYRDVFLICKDSVYVPLRGQRITVTGTAGSPTVHAVTTVRNDAAAVKSVTVNLTLLNAAGSSVATATGNSSVAANSFSDFNLTTSAVSSPSLWSPSNPNPYLYSLRTVVTVGGATVDSVVEKVGLRFFSWSGSGNGTVFSVNGTATMLRGVCMAQFMGWILNAVPDSRYAKQVAMIKAMGINSIRCSHYPRSQAFYDACDSVGMLVLCEVPTWGCGGTFKGNTTFWNHMYACDSEMVLEGYNHPCIYGWSMFNEATESTLQPEFTNENTIIHALDPVSGSGRVTLVACIQGGTKYPFDILGLNYDESSTASSYCLNTEAYGNGGADCNTYGSWYRNYVRGNAMDADMSTSCSEANMEDNTMRTHYWASGHMAGAHFWCFMDYSSGRNTTGREGIVDRLWLPKNVYFKMRNSLMGTATDYWANGTPTQMALTADNTSLKADGSDISLITATLRDASNACVHTTCNVTFTATASPASCVRLLYGGHSTSLTDSGNPVTVAVEGGRAGVLLRTSRMAGTITVSATATCVSSTPSVTLTSTAPAPETIGPFVWSTSAVRSASPMGPIDAPRLKTAYTVRGVLISFPAGISKTVRIIDCQGKERASYALQRGSAALVDQGIAGGGIVFAVWNDKGRRMITRLNMVR